jgi:hypothetical protein
MRISPHIAFSTFGRRFRLYLLVISTISTLNSRGLGQEIIVFRPPDTSFSLRQNAAFEPLFLRPTLPFLLTPTKSELDFPEFLQQSLFQVNQTGGQFDQNLTTLQWMWRDELVRGSQDELWRDIVGAVEAGAVTYLAYRHLKRYGLK